MLSKRFQAVMLSGTLLLSCFAPLAEAADHAVLDIPGEPLSKALSGFAKQADISIIRPRISFRDGRANEVKGTFSLKSGLSRLLKDTGFDFEILSPTAVRIFRASPKAPPIKEASAEISFLPPLVEEIEVTTTRRKDFADKLPYSMSVTSGASLERLFGGSTNDAVFKIAGLAATNQGDSRNKIIVRGLSDGAFSGRTQALVTTYIDYARMLYNAPEPSFKLVDISSIEVLRGPQGTLYGSGSLGGLYRVVTNKPNLAAFEGEMTITGEVTDGGAPSQDYTAMINIPVIEEKFGVRAVAYYEENGGYIDDIRLNLNDVNDSELYGARLATKLKLWQNGSLTLGVNFQHHTAEDTNYYNGALGPLLRDNYTQEPRYDILRQPYLTFEADTSFADIVSTFSYINRDMDNYYDGARAVPKLTDLPLIPAAFEDDRHIKTISNETHFSSKSGSRLEWMAGFLLSHRHENIIASLTAPGSASFAGLGPTDVLFSEDLTDNLDEVALFGETTYFLTERLALTGGLRWFHYKNSAVSLLDDVGVGAVREASGEQKKSGLIPKFTVSFYENEDRLYYLQIAQGYRLGGINLKGPTEITDELDPGEDGEAPHTDLEALTTFDSDKLLNIEIGFKHKFMDGQLRITGAAFYTRWNDIQSDQFDAAGLPTIGNIGNGRVIGGEAEITYQPTPTLQIHANAGWNASEITKVNNQFGSGVGAVEEGHLPGAPGFTLNFAGQYEFNLWRDLNAIIDVSYTYVGRAHLLYEVNDAKRSDAYHLGSARLEINKAPWKVTLFAENLFDTSANSFAFGNPFSLTDIDQVTPLRPRTFGVRLGWRY